MAIYLKNVLEPFHEDIWFDIFKKLLSESVATKTTYIFV